jgi:hypothetical protein
MNFGECRYDVFVRLMAERVYVEAKCARDGD